MAVVNGKTAQSTRDAIEPYIFQENYLFSFLRGNRITFTGKEVLNDTCWRHRRNQDIIRNILP